MKWDEFMSIPFIEGTVLELISEALWSNGNIYVSKGYIYMSAMWIHDFPNTNIESTPIYQLIFLT